MNKIFLFRVIIVLFLSCSVSASISAQESYLKAGANLNLSFLTNQAGSTNAGDEYHPIFPGFNLSYEKPFGNRFSWLVNIDLTRKPVYYQWAQPYPQAPTLEKIVRSDISFTPEVRFYFLKNQGLFYYKNQGFFLQLGVTLLQYEFLSVNSYNDSYLISPFSGGKSGDAYPAVPFGLGIKYPLNPKAGMEFNVQTNLNSQRHWWPLQIGMKYYWLRDKEGKPKPPEGIAAVPQSYFKAGVAANLIFNIGKSNSTSKQVHYPDYASVNLSYERTSGKRTSFALNLEALKKSLSFQNDNGEKYFNCTVTQFSFIPEIRVYLKNKYLLNNLNKGFFLQAGFELFHYSFWTDDNGDGSGFSLYPAGLNGWFERNVPVGFGYKYPLKNNKGIELNVNTNIMEMMGHGNNQTFSFGMKYFWMRKSK